MTSTKNLKAGITAFISFFLFLITVSSVNASIISGCTNISSSGYYELNQSIINLTSSCIEIKTTDIILDGKGFDLNGSNSYYGVWSEFLHDNLTIKNFNFNNWDSSIRLTITASNNIYMLDNIFYNSTAYDIYLESNFYGIINNNSISNGFNGIYITDSTDFLIENNYFLNNSVRAIKINSAHNNNFSNNTLISYKLLIEAGLILDGSNTNIIENNSFYNHVWGNSFITSNSNIIRFNNYTNNDKAVIFLSSALTNTFYNNIFLNNTYNIDLASSCVNNTFYNNIFNETNFIFAGTSSNYFNTTNQTGPNIIGGNSIGGNYYTNSILTGYSDICANENNDSFCDSPNILNAYNIDNLTLSIYSSEDIYDIILEDIIQTGYDDCSDCRHLTLYYYMERNDITELDIIANQLSTWWDFEYGIDSYFGNYIRTAHDGCGGKYGHICDTKYVYITSDYVIWRMDLNDTYSFLRWIDGQHSSSNLYQQKNWMVEHSSLRVTFNGVNNSKAIGWDDTGYISGAWKTWDFGYGDRYGSNFNYAGSNSYQWNGFLSRHDTGNISYLINNITLWYHNIDSSCAIDYQETYSSTIESYLNIGNNSLDIIEGSDSCFDFRELFVLQIEDNYREWDNIYFDRNSNDVWVGGDNPNYITYLYSLDLGISSGFNIMVYEPVWNQDYINNENIPVYIIAYNEDNNLTRVEYFANDNTTFFRNTTNIYCENCSLTDIFEINISRDGFTVGNAQKLTIIAYNHTANISKDVYFNILEFSNSPPRISIISPISRDYVFGDIIFNFIATDSDGTINQTLIWMDGTIYKHIQNISLSSYNYTEIFNFDDDIHEFTVEVWDNNLGWATDNVDFSTGLIIDFNIISPLEPDIDIFLPEFSDRYNIEENLTITYEISKNHYLLNFMEFYINDVLINNVTSLFYHSFNYTIDGNFTAGVNVLTFRCYYGESGNYVEKNINVFLNPYFRLKVLNGLTFTPVNNVKVIINEYDTIIGNYVKTVYTDSSGIVTFYEPPGNYLLTLSKDGYDSRNYVINEDLFGILVERILEPIPTNISVAISFNVINESDISILSNVELIELVNPSNVYSFLSNTSQTITAGTYSVKVLPIISGIYKPYYINLDISENLSYTINLELIEATNKIIIQTFEYEDSSVINNILIHIRKDDIFIRSIYKSSLEPLELYLEDGNYSFGGSDSNNRYRLVGLVNTIISNNTNINLYFRYIDDSDYVIITIGIFDTSNRLIENTITYNLYDINFSGFVESSYFTNGTTTISLIKDVYYKLILSLSGYDTKTVYIQENIDAYYKIIMYRTGETPDVIIGDDDVYVSGGRLIFNRVYDFLNIMTGGGLILGLVLMLITLWSLNNGEQKTPERTQLSYLLIEALGFTLIGIFPIYFGLLIIILIAVMLSKAVYPAIEGKEN